MKTPTLIAIWLALLVSVVLEQTRGQDHDPDWKPPGTEEQAEVDQANKRLGAVYKRLMDKLEPDVQKALKEAERSWIKWRDDEAVLIARVGGAGPHGSAMRVDFAKAQLKLISQRIEILNEYLAQDSGD